MTVTIWHNPACGTSRNVLALVHATGIAPRVIEYLAQPPTRDELVAVIAAAGLTPRGLMRVKGTPFAELGLGDPTLSDAALIDAMIAHPILINRPVVQTLLGTRLCRPSEVVLDILPAKLTSDFIKEDGEVIAART